MEGLGTMNNKRIAKYICNCSIDILRAMQLIDENAKGVLYVTDSCSKLVGSLSDGDIRRWIISGKKISASVSEVMNVDPQYLYKDNIEEAYGIMRRMSIRSLPIVDDNMIISDILFLDSNSISKYNSDALNGISVVIMAGGKGTRLLPYTKILPKPLIPIGDITIVERIMNKFHEYGASNFILMVGYKKEIIKSYFADLHLPYAISYIEEDQPLGTAGSLRLLDYDVSNPVIVTNCDVLINANYEDIIDFYNENQSDMTIVAAKKDVVVPYGILHYRDNSVYAIEEKPKLSYFINTGMYVINPNLFRLIPENIPYDMTDLIQQLLDNGNKICKYPIEENEFMDMGQFSEMKKMEQSIQNA